MILLVCSLPVSWCCYQVWWSPLQVIIIKYCWENKPTDKFAPLNPFLLILVRERWFSSVDSRQQFTQEYIPERNVVNHEGGNWYTKRNMKTPFWNVHYLFTTSIAKLRSYAWPDKQNWGLSSRRSDKKCRCIPLKYMLQFSTSITFFIHQH